MKTLGEKLRELREAKGLLLRQVAAELDVDPSFLSKIERGDKRPTKSQIIQLEGIYETTHNELLILYLSERVVYELQDEQDLAMEAIMVAEQKIAYLINGKNGN